jgi:Xaa-Pro aminopeptidase
MILEMLRTLLLTLAALAAAAQTIPLSEYAQRREQLRASLPEGLTVLWAYSPGPEQHDRNGFFQETNFYYLTGWNEPGAALLLCAACPEAQREIFFLPVRNPKRERYDGPMVAPGDKDATARTGFKQVLPMEHLEQQILQSLAHARDIHTLLDGHEQPLAKLAPLRAIKDARPSITQLRLRKSPAELALLQKAIDASIQAHFASWRATKPGRHEYEIAAVMQETYFALGCERNAYAPIVGSGPNSVILHYNRNRRKMDSGDILLMDVGGEYSMYAADITRSIPVNGKWTPRQLQIYNLVLGAQNAALAAAKPGVMLPDVTKAARDYLNAQGKGPNNIPWGDYLLHGVSHHIGLDVHDPFDPTIPLAEGNVITVEPGVYIASEQLGIRIEDMIVITKDGAKILTSALPRDAAEVERRMRP